MTVSIMALVFLIKLGIDPSVDLQEQVKETDKILKILLFLADIRLFDLRFRQHKRRLFLIAAFLLPVAMCRIGNLPKNTNNYC